MAEAVAASKCAVALTREELGADLPPVCMCCGAPATVISARSFWRQAPVHSGPTTGIIGLFRVLFEFSEAQAAGSHVLRAPFCDEHRNYWSAQRYLLLARIGMIALFVVGLFVAAGLALGVGTGAAIAWATLCVVGLGAAAGFIVYFQKGRIEQLEAKPDVLPLANVSKELCDALAALRPHRDQTYAGYSPDELASLQKRQRKLQIFNGFALPGCALVILILVCGVLGLIGPPTNLPPPSGGPQTRDMDLHCFDLLKRQVVSHEARSWLLWRPEETVESWDHNTTLAVVERLYGMGAKRVYFHPVLLVVILPDDAASRSRILDWFFTQVKKGQGERIPDEKQNYLLFTPT